MTLDMLIAVMEDYEIEHGIGLSIMFHSDGSGSFVLTEEVEAGFETHKNYFESLRELGGMLILPPVLSDPESN